jgi:hypothetical protein
MLARRRFAALCPHVKPARTICKYNMMWLWLSINSWHIFSKLGAVRILCLPGSIPTQCGLSFSADCRILANRSSCLAVLVCSKRSWRCSGISSYHHTCFHPHIWSDAPTPSLLVRSQMLGVYVGTNLYPVGSIRAIGTWGTGVYFGDTKTWRNTSFRLSICLVSLTGIAAVNLSYDV